jgi:hypothetical protein
MNSCGRRSRCACYHVPHLHDEGATMDYRVDLDPIHNVIRLTVTAEIITMELNEDCYRRLSQLASHGGPYAAIYDYSAVKSVAISTDTLRSLARRAPSVPAGRTQVAVGKEPSIYGLARLFQISAESVGKEFEVVHSLEEAYEIVGAHPEDFTQRLFPEAWPRDVRHSF